MSMKKVKKQKIAVKRMDDMATETVEYWYNEYYKKCSFSKLIKELQQINSELHQQGYKTHRRCRNQTLAVLKALKYRCLVTPDGYDRRLDW